MNLIMLLGFMRMQSRIVVEEIRFMESRGVKLDFILKAFSTSSADMWEPTREELHEAGVLTDVD